MAIGDVGISRARQGPSNSAAGSTPDSFGAGVGRAIKGLAGEFERKDLAEQNLSNAVYNRQFRMDGFDTERRFLEYKRTQVELQDGRFRDAEANGTGLTNTVEADLLAAQEEFLQGTPESQRDRYGVKLTEFTQSTILGAFSVEKKLGDEYFRNELNAATNSLGGDIYLGNTSYDEALASVTDMITISDLSEAEKEILQKNATSFLQGANFKADARYRLETGAVMSAQPPRQRALLDAISVPESAGAYNVRYNGHGKAGATFDDYSRHPQIYVQRPDGRWSSAAGRYQFTYTTWQDAIKAFAQTDNPLTDFSPESQDRAALWLAEKDYNARNPNGPSFNTVLASDDPVLLMTLKDSLAKTWEGLPDLDYQKFLSILTGKTQVSVSGDDRGGIPDLWGDPQFADISFDQKLALMNSAQSAYNAQQTANTKANTDAYNSQLQGMYRTAAAGGFTDEMIQQNWKNGSITKMSEETKLRGFMQDFNDNTQREMEVVTTISSGEGVLTQEAHGEALNNLYGDQARQAFGEQDQSYLHNGLYPMVENVGFVPSDIAQSLVAMTNSADPNARLYALDALLFMDDQNPRALQNSKGIGKGLIDDLSMYKAALAVTPSSEKASILDQLDMMNDPTMRPLIDARGKEAVKLLTADYPLDSLSGKLFDDIIPFNDPVLPMDFSQQMALNSTFAQNYIRGYERSGSDDIAFNYAQEQTLRTWGVTELGGSKRIVKNGPEKFYDRTDLVDEQIRAELGRRGFPPASDYVLSPTVNAAVEGALWATDPAKAGHNASYTVRWQDAAGVWFELPPAEGNAWAFNGELGENGTPQQYPQEQMNDIATNAAVTSAAERLTIDENRLLEYQSTLGDRRGELPTQLLHDAETTRMQTVIDKKQVLVDQRIADRDNDPELLRLTAKADRAEEILAEQLALLSFEDLKQDKDADQKYYDAFAETRKALDEYEFDISDTKEARDLRTARSALSSYRRTILPSNTVTPPVRERDATEQELFDRVEASRNTLDVAQDEVIHSNTTKILDNYFGAFDIETASVDELGRIMGNLLLEQSQNMITIRQSPEFQLIQDTITRRRQEEK